MVISIPTGIAGFFPVIEVLNRSGEVVRKIGPFPNLITDQGLARLSSNTNDMLACYTYIRVGTGNSEPSFTDNNLQNQIAYTSSNMSGTGGVNLAEGFVWRRYTWTFDEGAAVGNISELGTGWGSGANTLFSRALIRDALGNPTSITILADEQLRVTWEHRRYWPTSDVTGQLVNEGNKGGVYNYTVRAADVSGWVIGATNGSQINISNAVGSSTASRIVTYDSPSELGNLDGFPTGTPSSYIGSTIAAGTGPNFVRRTVRFSLTQAVTSNGISCILFQSYASGSTLTSRHAFQVQFEPPIVKTNEDILEIDLEINWARA